MKSNSYLLAMVKTCYGELTYNYGVDSYELGTAYGIFSDKKSLDKSFCSFTQEMTEYDVEVCGSPMSKQVKLDVYFSFNEDNGYIITKQDDTEYILYMPFSEKDKLENGGSVPILRLTLGKFTCSEDEEYIDSRK